MMNLRTQGIAPHAGQPVLHTGADLQQADAAVILMHGRGAGAHDIIGLSAWLPQDRIAYLAPEAMWRTWYPQRFLAEIAHNQPGIDSGLQVIAGLIKSLAAAGISQNKILIGGFSQGACLALEYAIRHPGRYGGVAGLSGGLIGPPGTQWQASESLQETPVFLGCSDVDFHIPKERVEESAEALRNAGAKVDMRLYPGMEHTINEEEVSCVRLMVKNLVD